VVVAVLTSIEGKLNLGPFSGTKENGKHCVLSVDLVLQLEVIRVACSQWASNVTRISRSSISIFPRVTSGETLPPDAAAGHNDPVTGLSADGTFHLLSVRGPLTNLFPRT
jgi:hypothetical protein